MAALSFSIDARGRFIAHCIYMNMIFYRSFSINSRHDDNEIVDRLERYVFLLFKSQGH